LTVTPQAHGNAGWGYIHWGYLNAGGLFTGILVSLIATEIFVKLRKKNLIIKMPDNVPPAVGKAFAAVIPGTVTLFVFGILAFILASINVNSLHDLIFNSIQKPLQGFGQGLGSAVLLATLMNLFWFFGLHGGNILDPVINAIYLPALETNAALVQQGAAATNLVTKSFFDSFVHLGGCGATLALILAIFLVSKKRKDYREVAKLGAPNGIFNINEPMMFGLPIILNPVLLIPFLLIPGILTTIAYMATVSGIVPPTYVQVPWITPVGISGFLATGGNIMGAILGLVNFAIATLIYMPFVMLAERIDTDRKEEKELNSSKTLSI
jgi:cellobiose PTS system EIIC component